MNVIEDLVRADRDGDFLLCMVTIQNLCPLFLGCGSFNHQLYVSFYLEQLKNPKNPMHELQASLLHGDFVIKGKGGSS
jgi:hypothetical protein